MPNIDDFAPADPAWRWVLHLGVPVAERQADAVSSPASSSPAAAELFSPALLSVNSHAPAGDAGLASRSRLLNRFVRSDGLRWIRSAQDAGVPVLAIKGLATAHALYPDPDLRAMSDADILVRKADLPRLLAHFAKAGLHFRPVSAVSPWGFVSDASFQALTSADEISNVDLHVHPDGWPLHRALDTEAVFAEAVSCTLKDGALPVPCPLHMLIITISHAARDRFQIETAKSFVDTTLLLRRHGRDLDWRRFEHICRQAWLLGPACVYLALLEALGGDVSAVPERLRRRPRGREFARALQTLSRLDTEPLGSWQRLRREALLSSSPAVFLARMAWRLKGLIRPNRGLPESA